ncbi:MAG: class I SAM-dependent methyltransferase [Cellulosilyticaceae bacterium]
MCNKQISKLENVARLLELAPKDTLVKTGFKKDMTLCDIGAGTGVFTFEAAKISDREIYALEISEDLIELLERRKAECKKQNITIKKVESEKLPLDDKHCDMALMVTVFHELAAQESMLDEIKRILKEEGKLLIIEFHKKQTPMGPSIDHRIAEEEVEKIAHKKGFKTVDKFVLGDNFYAILFE